MCPSMLGDEALAATRRPGEGINAYRRQGRANGAQKSTDRDGAAKVDDEGFEPPASCMLGKRSTN